ncbi:MAG: hypothetical protein ABI614_26090 [Planctomycetota bacterium]
MRIPILLRISGSLASGGLPRIRDTDWFPRASPLTNAAMVTPTQQRSDLKFCGEFRCLPNPTMQNCLQKNWSLNWLCPPRNREMRCTSHWLRPMVYCTPEQLKATEDDT